MVDNATFETGTFDASIVVILDDGMGGGGMGGGGMGGGSMGGGWHV